MHSARYQNDLLLFDFQTQMRKEEGGGWPEKVDKMIGKYASGVEYSQYEGTDPSSLELALHTGRMPSVTYNGHDPHYGERSIAHMVNLVYLDDKEAAILDNNFIEDIVWMTRQEFLDRWKGSWESGWSVYLHKPSPPPLSIQP